MRVWWWLGLWGIGAAIPTIAVLLAKDKIGPMFLFLIGIAVGIFIGKGFFEKK